MNAPILIPFLGAFLSGHSPSEQLVRARRTHVTERIETDTLRGGTAETRKIIGADHERRYHQRGRTTKPATHLERVWLALRDSLPRCHCEAKAEDVLAGGLRLFRR